MRSTDPQTGTTHVKSRIDIPLLVASLLLAITVLAFAAGLTPYPYGFFILSFILLGRYLQLNSRR